MNGAPSLESVRALMQTQRSQRPPDSRRCKPQRHDPRVWRYTFEHAQHKEATLLRFLPPHDSESDPIVSITRHNIAARYGWSYRQPCPPTGCPVCAYRAQHPEFYLKGDRYNYASNVLVVHDPVCPDNHGQVGIFEYGVTIHDILMDDVNNGVNPFDPYSEGTLFQVRAAWYSRKAVPKYVTETYFLESDPLDVRPLPLRHRLRDYPLMHDAEELAFQFSRTLACLERSEDGNSTDSACEPSPVTGVSMS